MLAYGKEWGNAGRDGWDGREKVGKVREDRMKIGRYGRTERVIGLDKVDLAPEKISGSSTHWRILGPHRRLLSIDRMRFRPERKGGDAATPLRTENAD